MADLDLKKYTHLIVGCGFVGAVAAEQIAKNDDNARVLIVDRRNFISGNMFDEKDEHGIIVQKFGVHIMNSNDDEVIEYIKKFSDWTNFKSHAWVDFDDGSELVSSPFNFDVIDAWFSKEDAGKMKEELIDEFGAGKKISLFKLLNSENRQFQNLAEKLFEKDVRPYTAKQWGVSETEIDKSVIDRVPLSLDYSVLFDDKKFVGLPVGGFVQMFEKMLSNPRIDVALETDALDFLTIQNNSLNWTSPQGEIEKITIPVLWTGAIDELFNYQFGKLGYRTLDFEYEVKQLPQGEKYAQAGEGIVHPAAQKWTRQMEFKWLYPDCESTPQNVSVVSKEFPRESRHADGEPDEPYYPLFTDDNMNRHKEYVAAAEKVQGLFIAGRLADFKYYFMDAAIKRGIEIAKVILNYR